MGKKGKFKKWDDTCVEYEVDDKITNYFDKRIKKTAKKSTKQEDDLE